MPVWLPLLVAALAVLAIYLIRPTASTLPVASTLLWRRLLAARRRRRDRLRWLISLLLAMTVAGCLALAAGQAPWLQRGGGDPIALAFDPSPTMRADLPDGDGTRLDLAVAEARRIVAEADPRSRFTLGADPNPMTGAEARLALAASFEPQDANADPAPAIPAAQEVYLFTDGVGDWRPIIDPGAETHTVSVLAPARNAGIIRFTTRPPPTHDAKPEALLEVLATDATAVAPREPLPVELTVTDSDRIRIRRQLELTPGDRFTALIDLAGFAPGPVTARIKTPGDAFPPDDRASLIDAGPAATAPGARPAARHAQTVNRERRLLINTRSRRAFEDSAAARAFAADPSVEVVAVLAEADEPIADTGERARGQGPAPGDGDAAGSPAQDPTPAADIAVFHRSEPTRLPTLPSLFLDSPEGAAVGGLSAAEAPPVLRRINRVEAGHPLLAGVSLLGLPAAVPARALDPRCRPLAAAGNRAAIAVCDPADPAPPPASLFPGPSQAATRDVPQEELTLRSVVIAFDLDLSPLAQRPDLAALLQNAAEWLAADAGDTGVEEATATGLQDQRATRINDSDLEPVAAERLAELTEQTRRPWSWRTLALAGLLLASIEAITFFRGLTV